MLFFPHKEKVLDTWMSQEVSNHLRKWVITATYKWGILGL